MDHIIRRRNVAALRGFSGPNEAVGVGRNGVGVADWRQQSQKGIHRQLEDSDGEESDNNYNSDANLLPIESPQRPAFARPNNLLNKNNNQEDDDEDDNDIVPTETSREGQASFSANKPPTSKQTIAPPPSPPIVSSDRLTLLKEPDELPLLTVGSSNYQQGRDNDNLSSRGAATLLHRTSASATLITADLPSRHPAFSADHRTEPNTGLLDHQMFLLGSSSMLLLVLLGLIVHNWLHRRRRPLKSPFTSCYPDQRSPLLPSCCVRRSTSVNQEAQFFEGSVECETNCEKLTCAGERIQLVERRPPAAHNTKEALDDIRVLSAEDSRKSIPGKLPDVDEEMNDGKFSSTMVIMKRKLASNSFVVSARTARPRVKLIKAKVRKFIDEEAQEIHQKREQGDPLTWHSQLFAFFLDKLHTVSKSDAANQEDVVCEELEPFNIAPNAETCPAEESANVQQEEDSSSNHRLSVEIHQPPSIGGQLLRAATQADADQCNGQVVSDDQQVLGLLPPLCGGAESRKLTPSPIVNDGCSSISACSLFSASPIEQRQTTSSCGCALFSHQEHLKSDFGAAAVNLIGGQIPGADLRSKSQGHTPCHLSGGGGGGGGHISAANFRPCCSTSPSTFNSLMTGAEHQQQQQPSACCLPFQQHQQLMEEKLRLISAQLKHLGPAAQSAAAAAAMAASGHHLSNSIHAHSGRCSNRIKRQYENYYDDEREDAYRKLTASIGMNYATSSGTGAENYDDLLSMSHHRYTSACHHHLANQQSAFLPPNLSSFSSPLVASNLQPAANQATTHYNTALMRCRCCNHQQPPAVGGQMRNFDNPSAQANATAANFNQTRPFHDQHLLDKSYLFRSGDMLSSTSTSLGGSDSGFISAARNTCRNPLCGCQQANVPNVPLHPMSILIQQPSMSTPPPPPLEQKTPEMTTIASSDLPVQNDVAAALAKSEAKQTVKSSAAEVQACARPKWKNRRRLSHNHSHHNYHQLPLQAHLCNDSRVPRRMSIAGDRLTALHRPTTEAPLSGSPQQAQQHGIHHNHNYHHHHHHHHLPLQHRASIAADGSWGLSRSSCNPLRYNPPASGHQSQSYSHNQTPAESSFAPNQHRPSDASLYEANYCANLSGKSNYSSSGGSSSGIGVSGSACTNTPTSIAFPYGSFGNRTEILTDLGHLPRDQSLYDGQHHHQCVPVGYLHEICNDSACQAASCTSRKYSLPVQLESHSAERLSPSRSKLLFEKNLQQTDVNGSNLRSTAVDPLASTPGRQASGLPGEAQAVSRRGRLSESRRNSQTITRQSSFWLEDNSIMPSVGTGTNSEDCSQVDLSQVFFDSSSCSQDQISNQQAQERRDDDESVSQRFSTSSMILSADSIDSVKQKPPTQPAEPPEAIQNLPGDNGETSELTAVEANIATDESSPKESSSGGSKSKNDNQSGTSDGAKKTRLSSSSTSSTASTPSPDFSRPSERILSKTSKSSSLPKRNLIGKIRTRRYPRLSTSTNSSESTKSTIVALTLPTDSTLTKPDAASVPNSNTDPKEDTNSPKLTTEVNSSSLERQCRELWKLRAALHDDSCVGDNWSNYHQRLSRRYDSGYKSIENQLSSSLEGNLLAGSSSIQPASGGQSQANVQDVLPRPQSGCSQPLGKKELDEGNEISSEEQTLLSPSTDPEDATSTTTTTTTATSQEKSAELISRQQESSTDTIQGKLADLELDDIALECLLSNTPDRECNSRSSKSSEEEDKRLNPVDHRSTSEH